MNTRKLMSALIAASLAATSLGAVAGHNDSYYADRARVVNSTPIYERVSQPRQECWTETVYDNDNSPSGNNNSGGAVLGAIAGGLLGAQVGKGNGKIAAAAVGAATGAVVGDRWNDGRYSTSSYPRDVQRCRTVEDYRQSVVGYDVTYRYQGRDYTTRLPYEPGKWVDVNVNVSLADRRY
jgi:uncharacterized protein YcfJ